MAEYWVRPEGSDSNSGESWEQAWRTLDPLEKIAKKLVTHQELPDGAILGIGEGAFVHVCRVSVVESDLGPDTLTRHRRGEIALSVEEHYFVDQEKGDDWLDGLDWSTALCGFFGVKKYLSFNPLDRRNIFIHVKGRQPFDLAVAEEVPVRCLITVNAVIPDSELEVSE